MKITKRKVSRQITLNEFLLQKNYGIFEKYRRVGKNTNFLLIFGGSPRVYYTEVLEKAWPHEEIVEYIRKNHLEEERERLASYLLRDSAMVIDYLTVASDMISKFFKTYPGLMDRIKRNREFAKENGYVRSIFGATRVLNELMLAGSFDKQEQGLMLNNLNNVAANCDIQNLESCIINTAMVRSEKRLEEEKVDALLFNNIHDSADFYVHKKDLQKFSEIIKQEFEKEFPEFKGIKLPIDFEIVDITKGHYYKHGEKF